MDPLRNRGAAAAFIPGLRHRARMRSTRRLRATPFRTPSGGCPPRLRRLERRQPLGELAVRGTCACDDGGYRQGFEKMTRDAMTGGSLAQPGLLGRAARLRVRAAGVETAAGRRVEWARHVALQHDALGAQARVG